MSAAFFLYIDDKKKPEVIRSLGEAIGAFALAVEKGESEHVRLDYSS